MLRRDFLISASILTGGVFLIRPDDVCAALVENSRPVRKKRILHFHGHPRYGCATPPELMPLLENGICTIP